MKKHFFLLAILILVLTACGTEIENVEEVSVNYWENGVGNQQDEVISNKNIVNTFVNAVNDAKKLDEDNIIKTKPLLSFNLVSKDEEQGYHLWITSSGIGYIQNLYPSEGQTFELSKTSVENLTKFVDSRDNVDVINDVEFEE
ncbi:hypothetical protein WQ57_21405 [Mesobacillus campisalis]|uniref:YhfM-like domain-containing protein n=1 Tax=Mesobacillus campisalis TaxID=1408103 RepID=A0A0M2SPC1_9BACI|nr:hypothetical protein [Mesobacillus campisalis]KKK36078.1 hypothetical protein WQ57_21405 [Mesobacillus campisalis]